MKTVNIYLRKTDASAIEVDSNNRPSRSVAAIHRNEPLTLNIHVFDGTASTQMTQEQLAAFAAAWNLNIAPSPNMEGPLCLQSTSATVGADGTISVIVDVTDTVQSAAEIGNDTRAIWAAELTGTPGDSEQPNLILQWRIAYINRVASENEPPPTAETNNYYPKPVVDALFANLAATLEVPSDLNDLTDNDDLLASKIESVSALPTPAVGILNRAYFLTADDGTKKAGTTWKCVADGESYVFQQIQTDLNQLTDADNLLFDGDYDSLDNKPTIPTDLSSLTDTTGLFAAKENTANKATDFSTVNNVKFPTTQAVKDFAQNETLTELTGADVTVAPWTQSKWSASGTCSLTATGWAASGRQAAYIVITLAAGSTPSVVGTEEVEDGDALSEAGVYECFLKNVDGKIYFRQISFTGAVA